MNSRVNVPATVAISMERSYNPLTREFHADLEFTALQNLTGQFKYNIELLEDGIVWPQNGTLGGPNYVHDWTVRTIMNGALGTEIVNGTWNQNQVLNESFDYTVPVPGGGVPDIIPDSCRVVVFVYKVGSPLNSNGEIQQAEQWTLTTPDFVATIAPQSPDVIASSSTPAQYEAVIHNVGLMNDTYGINLSFTGPAGWTQEYTTDNGTFAAGQTDSLTVASGDSTVIHVTINANSIDGFGDAVLNFQSGNNLGMSGSSSFKFVTETGNDILVLDAEDDDYQAIVTACLDAVFAGTYGVVSRTALHPAGVNLANFKAIFWSAGTTFPAFYPEEVTALQTYLDNGGRLFISGQDIGSDIFETSGMSQFAQGFYHDYLHAEYVRDASNWFLINGYSGDPITNGISFVAGAIYDRSLDVISPYDADATAILKYMNGPDVGALRAETADYKVVYLGLGLEQIDQAAIKDTLVARTIRWFYEGMVGILDHNPTVQTFSLAQNYPNPFNPETVINYSLKNPTPTQTQLVIFNSLGQKIRTLVNGKKSAGRYQAVWNGTDDAGRSVSSGIYFYKLTSGSNQSVQKMILMR